MLLSASLICFAGAWSLLATLDRCKLRLKNNDDDGANGSNQQTTTTTATIGTAENNNANYQASEFVACHDWQTFRTQWHHLHNKYTDTNCDLE